MSFSTLFYLNQQLTEFHLIKQLEKIHEWANKFLIENGPTKDNIKIINQAFENFDNLLYRELKKSLKIDRRKDALWRVGLE